MNSEPVAADFAALLTSASMTGPPSRSCDMVPNILLGMTVTNFYRVARGRRAIEFRGCALTNRKTHTTDGKDRRAVAFL